MVRRSLHHINDFQVVLCGIFPYFSKVVIFHPSNRECMHLALSSGLFAYSSHSSSVSVMTGSTRTSGFLFVKRSTMEAPETSLTK